MIMFKFTCLFSTILCASALISTQVSAQSCTAIDQKMQQNSTSYYPRLSMQVVGQKGYRTHFYAAPVERCKIKQLFLIPKDSVVVYSDIKSEGQTWIDVMYVRRDGETVQGWMKRKDFKVTGKIGM